MRARCLLIVAAVVAVGCASPYRGPVEKPWTPKPKQKPDGSPESDPILTAGAQKCSTDFDGPAKKLESRKPAEVKKAKKMAQNAGNDMEDAKTFPADKRKEKYLEVLTSMRNALKTDPYNADATFQMAVAYAWLGKQKCALALLQRLQDLAEVEAFAGDVEKVTGTGADHEAFKPFAKKAKSAMGQ